MLDQKRRLEMNLVPGMEEVHIEQNEFLYDLPVSVLNEIFSYLDVSDKWSLSLAHRTFFHVLSDRGMPQMNVANVTARYKEATNGQTNEIEMSFEDANNVVSVRLLNVWSPFEILQDFLHRVSSVRNIRVDGFHVDPSFIQSLSISTRKARILPSLWDYFAWGVTVHLTDCDVDELDEEDLIQFYNRFSSRNLVVRDCRLHPNTYTDKVLRGVSSLKSVEIEGDGVVLPFLTDRTLDRWTKQPPSRVSLHNTRTAFSVGAVIRFMASLNSQMDTQEDGDRMYDMGIVECKSNRDVPQLRELHASGGPLVALHGFLLSFSNPHIHFNVIFDITSLERRF